MYRRYWDSHSSSSSSLRRRLPCRPACTQRTSTTSYNCLVWLRHPPISFGWEPLPLPAWSTGDSMNQSDLDDVQCILCRREWLTVSVGHNFIAWLLWSKSVDRRVLGFDCVSVIAQLPFLCINNVCRCMFSFISFYVFLVMYTFLLYTFLSFILHCFWWCTHVLCICLLLVTRPHLVMRVYLSIGVASVMDFSSRVYRSGIL